MHFFYLKLIILLYGDKNFLLYRQIFLREENFAISRFFAKSRNLIPVNIKIFCQPRNFISRISKIFWPTAKFISTKFNHENLENLMNGIPTKLYESKKVEQIEVKLTCYHKTNLSKMTSWFLKSHDHTRRGTTYFKWLECCRDRKCTEKWRNLFGTKHVDPLVSEPSVEQDDSNILQIDEGLTQHLSSKNEKDSCDSEWESEDGNIFDVIAQELWFVIFIDFLQFFPKYTSLNAIFFFSIPFFSLYEIVLD